MSIERAVLGPPLEVGLDAFAPLAGLEARVVSAA
jgi:hypothetical protein